ncbi:hypothetical protein WJX81_002922 [Elliptochloris bilobata]|uniref:Uncharacterized protein n=1 Tax=Elliptochloris bilobata TaxID=381761 RepID=A0AAW1S8U9_9CHLO
MEVSDNGDNKENVTCLPVAEAAARQADNRVASGAPCESKAQQDLAPTQCEWQQLLLQRDEAVKQQRRLEASRNELARQQGQFKGLIAKLEGAVSSGEKRLHSLAAELEAVKARCAEAEADRDVLLEAAGVTPERCRAAKAQLFEAAKLAARQARDLEQQKSAVERMLEREVRERSELGEFASLEHAAEAEAGARARAQVTELLAADGARAEQLKAALAELAAARVALQDRDAQVAALTQAHAGCGAAASAAAREAAALRQKAAQLAADRQQAAANLRRAENEVDLISAGNEQMFRYINYVRGRLAAAAPALGAAAPELLGLTRDLSA